MVSQGIKSGSVMYEAEDLRKFPSLENIGDRTLAPYMRAAYDLFKKGAGSKIPCDLIQIETVYGYYSPMGIDIEKKYVEKLEKFINKNHSSILRKGADIVKKSIRGYHGHEYTNPTLSGVYNISDKWVKENVSKDVRYPLPDEFSG